MENKFISFEFISDGKKYNSTVNLDKILYFERYKLKTTRFYLVDGTILDVCIDYEIVKDRIDKIVKT